jgi:hypothetical protein
MNPCLGLDGGLLSKFYSQKHLSSAMPATMPDVFALGSQSLHNGSGIPHRPGMWACWIANSMLSVHMVAEAANLHQGGEVREQVQRPAATGVYLFHYN